MVNTVGTSPGYPKRTVYVYRFCGQVAIPSKVVEFTYGRDGGTSEPHHPNHGKHDTLYPERVND
jgi:hypothetical protein